MINAVVCFALTIVTASLDAQTPAGWKIVKSPKPLTRGVNGQGQGGACQVAVPANWIPCSAGMAPA